MLTLTFCSWLPHTGTVVDSIFCSWTALWIALMRWSPVSRSPGIFFFSRNRHPVSLPQSMGAYGGIPVAIGEIHSPGPPGNSGPSMSEMSCGHWEDLIPEVVLHLCTVHHKPLVCVHLLNASHGTEWFFYGVYQFKFLQEPHCPL